VWWIRQSILHALSEQGGAFRLPPKRANLMYRLDRAISASISGESHMPTPEELAITLNVSVKEVHTLLQANADNYSLNAELDDESHAELGDVIEQTTIPSVEDEMQEQSRREELLLQMSELTPKERLVLTLRHGVSDNQPKSIGELAEFINRSPENVIEVLGSGTSAICESLSINESELAELLLYTNPNAKARAKFWNEIDDRPAGMSPQIAEERRAALHTLRIDGAVQKTVDALPLEQRTIVKIRYGVLEDELTLRDIGEILGLSRERVRQIEARAEARCRRSVKRDRR